MRSYKYLAPLEQKPLTQIPAFCARPLQNSALHKKSCLGLLKVIAPEEQDVYSSRFKKPPRSGGAQCALACLVYMPLLTERGCFGDAELSISCSSGAKTLTQIPAFCARPEPIDFFRVES